MTEQRKDFKNLKGSLTQITLLLVLVQSNLMRSRITNDNLIKQISSMIEKVEPAYFKGADEFTNALLAVLENIVGNNKVLLNSSISIIRYVLPALLKKFRSEANDAKMMSLKIFTDIFTVFLNDESIFDMDSLKP